jgi:hypothetical protein
MTAGATSTKAKLTLLETVYPPISNQEAVWLQDDAEVVQQFRQSDFYMIAGRAEATYQDLKLDEGSQVLTLTFVIGDNFVDPVRINLSELPGVVESPGDGGFEVELGPKLIRIWDGDGDPRNLLYEVD